jgi:hypothetical protein
VSARLRLLAVVVDEPRRQRLYQIRSLGLTESHQALRIVAGLAPDEVDIALRSVPPRAAVRNRGRGRHRAVLCVC